MKTDYGLARWSCAVALAAVWMLAGCASDRVDWDSRVGGYTYDEAVVELGPPDKEAELSDGSRVAEWLSFRSGGSAYMGYGGGYGYPGRYRPYYGPDYYGIHATPVREYWIRLTFNADGTLSAWRKVTR